jgi:hypothetical protein
MEYVRIKVDNTFVFKRAKSATKEKSCVRSIEGYAAPKRSPVVPPYQ